MTHPMPAAVAVRFESATANDVDLVCESLQRFNHPYAGAIPLTAVNVVAKTCRAVTLSTSGTTMTLYDCQGRAAALPQAAKG